MPRLQILHHKSYHPYNEKNKQRVREDEAKARAEELLLEQRAIDAESEARLTLLRRRAGSPGAGDEYGPASSSHEDGNSRERAKERRQRERLDFDFPSETKKGEKRREHRDRDRDRGPDREIKFETGGHVNFWADLESGKAPAAPAPPTPEELAKRKAEQEADKFTMYLSRPDRETKPWYTNRDLRRVEDTEGGDDAEYRRARDRRRDVRAKDRNDPLTDIHKSLASQRPPPKRPPRAGGQQSERERALALLANKKGTSVQGRPGWDTPERTWTDEFERQKDAAGHRYNADTWDRSRSRRR